MSVHLLFPSMLVVLSSRLVTAWICLPARWPQVNRQSLSLARLHASKRADDFFGLYDDDELWNVLNVHQRLTGQQESKKGEKESPEPNNGAAMHESVVKSYGEETMQNLLNLHESLKQSPNGRQEEKESLETLRKGLSSPPKDDKTTIPPSLHDLVQQAVGEIEAEDTVSSDSSSAVASIQWDESIQNKIDNIRAIASDVDGTLLTSQHTLHPRSRQAVRRVLVSDKKFFLATGKTRKGALGSLGVEMKALLETVPGVFIQGLYCIGDDGEVIFEQKLTNSAVAAVEELANKCNVSLVAYDGDSLYSPELTKDVIELSERYGEPKVIPLDVPLADYTNGIHKILVMDSDVDMLTTVVRPQLEALAKQNKATVTQAVPTMLEWMPEGCSKAHGVAMLCESMGVDPSTQLLAIGDAENDAGMLEMASIGVAVGNACPHAQEAADFLMEETNDEGGAGSAMELFGGLDII